MRIFIVIFNFAYLSYSCLTASTIDSNFINGVFTRESTLSAELINKIDFRDFDFEVGIKGAPRIVSNLKGGTVVLKWGDDERSMVQMRVYSQKRNDHYVQELDVPMDVFNGIRSENSIAALGSGKLRESWKKSQIKDIGDYCLGQYLSGYGAVVISSGYFFNQDYGFCLHISSPDKSGVDLLALEKIGKIMMEEISRKIHAENITPNPLAGTGPFLIAKETDDKKVSEISQVERNTALVHQELGSGKILARNDTRSSNWSWGITALLAAIVCAFYVLRKILKR